MIFRQHVANLERVIHQQAYKYKSQHLGGAEYLFHPITEVHHRGAGEAPRAIVGGEEGRGSDAVHSTEKPFIAECT